MSMCGESKRQGMLTACLTASRTTFSMSLSRGSLEGATTGRIPAVKVSGGEGKHTNVAHEQVRNPMDPLLDLLEQVDLKTWHSMQVTHM